MESDHDAKVEFAIDMIDKDHHESSFFKCRSIDISNVMFRLLCEQVDRLGSSIQVLLSETRYNKGFYVKPDGTPVEHWKSCDKKIIAVHKANIIK